MVNAIAKEIELQSNYVQDKKLQTIYFGGGSPSILDREELELLFNSASKHFDLSDLKEVTLEANPDDISKERLSFWHAAGVNRLSLGIQTFDEEMLKFMNRAHNSDEAIRSLDLILNTGFETSSADLIYAKTGSTLDKKEQKTILEKDLQILTSFPLQHISAYNLTIEEDTVFGKWSGKKKLAGITDDYASEQYQIVVDTLSDKGFVQYEISNFALNQKYAVHNTSYWQGHEYLGVGPSAHSYNLVSRQWNVANNHKYMENIEIGKLNFEVENLSTSEKVNDYLLTGLRTIWGVSLKKISQISAEIPTEFWDTIQELKSEGVLKQEQDTICIPQHARILSDRIASDLFWD